MIYGIIISIGADMFWDIVGTRLFDAGKTGCKQFPYRLVHKSRVGQALCEKCEKVHARHCNTKGSDHA